MSPLKFLSIYNLGMWPYLEIQSLQMQFIKWNYTGLEWALGLPIDVFIRGEDTERSIWEGYVSMEAESRVIQLQAKG